MQRTPTTLQPRTAAQAAAGHTTSVWQIRGVLLWLSEAAIRHQSSPPLSVSLFCCCACMCVRCVGVWRAPRKMRKCGCIFGNMVEWSQCPILDLMALVRASQSSCLFLFFNFFCQLFFCIMYVTQTPQTTDSARAVQGACYKLRVAKTLYTPAACQQSRKQHHTRAVVCPRCITAVASYLIRSSCFRYRTCDL